MKHANVIMIVIFTVIMSFPPFAAAKQDAIETFLAQQKNIRVFTDAADGFGNQTASQNVIIRLRQMGYHGKFEFIYPGYISDKITTLFDLPKNIADDYYDAKNDIEFIKLRYYVEHFASTTPITMGITGAYAFEVCDEARQDGADISKLSEMTCSNFANFAHAGSFIRIEPFLESEPHDEPFYKTDTAIYYYNDAAVHIQANSDTKYVVMPVASLEDAKKYLADDPRGQDLALKKPGIPALISNLERQSINVMPTYGYTLQLRTGCDEDTSNNCHFRKLSNMLQFILGARAAQIRGPADMRKPLVIPVFYDYNKEAAWIQKFVNGQLNNDITEPNIDKVQSLIKSLGLTGITQHFFIASADDPNVVKKMQQLQHGQILLLSMGALPKIIFDGLYNHTAPNIWPQIREGANTLNSLILTGRPHMRCGFWEPGFRLVKDEALRAWLSDFYADNESGLCHQYGDRWQSGAAITNNISKFILDAHDANSALSQYFSDLKQDALKPENDRIRYALAEIVKH